MMYLDPNTHETFTVTIVSATNADKPGSPDDKIKVNIMKMMKKYLQLTIASTAISVVEPAAETAMVNAVIDLKLSHRPHPGDY